MSRIFPPSTLAIFAHPDDETIALGARLQRLRTGHLVHVTDGAPRNGYDSLAHGFQSVDEYRQARATELDRAMNLAGISEHHHTCFGVPDQEAALHLLSLTSRILELLQRYHPEIVFTHPYEGGHPDHDACAFSVHHAVSLYESSEQQIPLIIEGAFYHAGPQGIATGDFLASSQMTQEALCSLSPVERMHKQALLSCFTTQQETLGYFPLAFERFRVAPTYNFCQPPHAPPVFYDQHRWGMTAQRFCSLAQQAEEAIQQEATFIWH
jgi:LmbE family N-acetylglucosaminyl deacetylase